MRFAAASVLVSAGAALAAALASRSSAEGGPERGPAVTLNHFYAVVDAATYAAARDSAFLTREFAPFEARTTVRTDMSYTGIYWYGRRTYFELFEPGGQGPVGSSGLALGVEDPGASGVVRQRFQDAIGSSGSTPVTRQTNGEQLPWFEMSYATDLAGLRVFLMEYHRDFLARWYGELTPARGIARADVLDRYVAKIGQTGRRDEALLRDVTGLRIALTADERETLVKQLRAASWTATDEGPDVVCRGPEGETLRLAAAEAGRTGILEVGFSLQHARTASHRLGTAELRLEGSTARLVLGASTSR